MNINRRGFLGIFAASCAPAFVGAKVLMPVKALVVPPPPPSEELTISYIETYPTRYWEFPKEWEKKLMETTKLPESLLYPSKPLRGHTKYISYLDEVGWFEVSNR